MPVDPLGFLNGSEWVRSSPAIQEMRVRSLGQKYTLEEEMATHSNILVWEIPQRGTWWAAVQRVVKSWTGLNE